MDPTIANERSHIDMEPDDRALGRRLVEGDERALETAYDRLSGRLYALAHAITGDPGEAEECVSDAFVHLWINAGAFDADRGSLAAWMTTIVRSRALDRRRRSARRVRISRDEGEGLARHTMGDGPREFETRATARVDLAGPISEALTALGEGHREAIELAYFEGMTQREIAEATGVPLGTVKTRIRAGMQKLRDAAVRAGLTEGNG